MSRRRRSRSGHRPPQNNRAHLKPNPDYLAAKAAPTTTAFGNTTGRPAARPFSELLNQITAQRSMTGPTRGMPRDTLDGAPFGPINPSLPAPISPARDDTGRPEPRIWEYPVGWNIPGAEVRLIPWSVLYQAAAQVDVMRRCIEVRKRHVRSLKWAFGVSADAIQAAYRADPRFGRDDLEQQLREKYQPAIDKLTQFWRKPWRSKGLTFGQWVNGIQDQHLTLDAVAIYPRCTYGGDVIDLEILDGSTIKPLADWRGARPVPPMPAYQQVLYGFPRGEYTATCDTDADGNQVLRGGYMADQLYYWAENFRPNTFYGFSAVEQALTAARLYMKRQGWMVSEYDDGSMPLAWLVPETADAVELDPRQRAEWERAINDDLSGQTAERHRIKLSYPGFKPEWMPSVDERYKPDYDLYLIKLLASFFGVPITELGFTESKGLGSSGYHEGQEDVMDRVGRRPDIAVLEEIINDISHTWLDAPDEIQFQFLGLESEDEAAQDAVADTRVRSGRQTLNEDRKRLGLPLYDFPEADMPMLMTQRGVVFLEDASKQAPPGELIEPLQAPKQIDADGDGQPDAPDDDTGNSGPSNRAAGQNGRQAGPKPDKAQDTTKAADPTTAVADSDSTRNRVHDQLAEDYPENAMGWLKQAVWSGPETVPTADIDYTNAKQWRASHEPEKVNKFKAKIKAGKLKPIVVVNTPDARKYIIIDGHHRALAYRALGIPAVAYIGRVAAKSGAWDQMHASQRVGAGSAAEKEAPPPAPPAGQLDKAVRDEIAAWRNWQRHARKRGKASSEFVFSHPEAEAIAKAGTGPKAAARQWPGWQRDEQTADIYSNRLRAMLTARIGTDRIARDWAAARGMATTKAVTPGAEDARIWLSQAGAYAAIRQALDDVLADAYAEGYLIGDRSAIAMVTGADVDWTGWTPGDAEAARLVLGDDGLGTGLARLLDEQGANISSIASNRLDELAKALADALANGDAPAKLAKTLRNVLDDPQWADMVAVTEINRAVSAATLATYAAMGVEGKSWMTAADDRVCPEICEPNAIDGAIPLGAQFSSGAQAPPGHPRCRCALDAETISPAEIGDLT